MYCLSLVAAVETAAAYAADVDAELDFEVVDGGGF